MLKTKAGLLFMRKLSSYLNSEETKETAITDTEAFTRKRKLSFTTVVGMILNSLTRSLQIELEDFYEYVLDSDIAVTKQAFSKARRKIKPCFFQNLSEKVSQEFYKSASYNTFKGYRILAIDGVTIELPNYSNLEYFLDIQAIVIERYVPQEAVYMMLKMASYFTQNLVIIKFVNVF